MNRLALLKTTNHLNHSGKCLSSISSAVWSRGLVNYKCFPSILHHQHNYNHHRTTTVTTRNNHNNATENQSDTLFDSYTMLEKIVSSPSIAQKVNRISTRYDEIMANMIDSSGGGGSSSDPNETKELSSLSQVSKLYTEFKSIIDEMNGMKELMIQAQQESSQEEEEEQRELIEECQSEIEAMEEQLEIIGGKLIESILPKNENDFSADAILEIRAGTGGDEAALFTGELMNCYEKVASNKGWVFDILSQTQSDLKGVKEAAISISSSNSGGGGYYEGDSDGGNDTPLGPYGYFKFESGVHRVQRVPVNDVRIHTSAASVAVLPAPSSKGGKSDDLLPTSELKIETMRASGAGGQHVNTTDSAVRITHIPTGITASIQDERSQHKNKAKAIKLISARVRDKIEADEARQRGDAKNSLMGGGDRSERIRTYNFPQDRVTDHRCKHSEHGIDQLLSGGSGGGEDDSGLVGVFLPHMKKMERSETMAALEEEEEATNNKSGKGSKKKK